MMVQSIYQIYNFGSKPVDGNPLPHKMALWKQKRPIEKNPEFEIRKYGK
jgi:hypothetical protein